MNPVVPLTVEDLASRVGSLPPMPRAAGQVLRLVQDPNATAEQIGRVIETDPALTAATLRLVNSALFGLQRHISSLTQTVVLLGFLRLRSLTLATVIAGLRDLVPQSAAEARDAVWDHSVSVALGARVITERLGMAWGEESFVAGLLHDCGRLVMLGKMTGSYRRLMETSGGHLPCPTHETADFGFSHSDLGGALLRCWNLAPQLVEVAEQHHSEKRPEGPFAKLVAVVKVADHLVGSSVADDPQPSAGLLGLDEPALKRLRRELPAEVAEGRGVLLAL